MSLVAYAASSDEDSDLDDNPTPQKVDVPSKNAPTIATVITADEQISDEDEDYVPIEAPLVERKSAGSFIHALPKPKHITAIAEEIEERVIPAFSKLPMPKSCSAGVKTVVEEEDDEFLHKKATPLEENGQQVKPTTKATVKIQIPSLKDFCDVDKEVAEKTKAKSMSTPHVKGSSLMSLLPKAKSEQNFAKTPTAYDKSSSTKKGSVTTARPAFIPDTVKNRRPAHNTEGVDGIKVVTKGQKSVVKPKIALVNCSDSEEMSDDEDAGGDFFSLNSAEKLPEVSANEINIMVAKRAAKMAEATHKYLSAAATSKEIAATDETPNEDDELRQAQKRYHDQQLDAEAVQALVGGSAKRRRKQQQDIQVMDISSAQVLPDREEWMRTALASSTVYQPTGVLVDEEPAAGTRRKHQITYLAHRAKANEAELQAMWAVNRMNRRATQSKYGF